MAFINKKRNCEDVNSVDKKEFTPKIRISNIWITCMGSISCTPLLNDPNWDRLLHFWFEWKEGLLLCLEGGGALKRGKVIETTIPGKTGSSL